MPRVSKLFKIFTDLQKVFFFFLPELITLKRYVYLFFPNKVDTDLASRVSAEPDFNHIQIATPLVGCEFDEYTQKDVTLDIQINNTKKAGKNISKILFITG